MRTFNEIPKEEYNNYKFCLEYLRNNKTIGTEEVEHDGIFHVHWRGPIDNNKVILQIKSILATQYVTKIYFWIENELVTKGFPPNPMSPGYPKLMQFRKYVEIKVFDKSIFNQITCSQKDKDKIWEYYNTGSQSGYRYKTDVFRWIVTSIYGGVYSDMDTLFLRDIRDIHINNYSSTWPPGGFAELCILKVQKASDLYHKFYLNNPSNKECFLLIDPPTYMPRAFAWDVDNLNFVSLPTSFFDPLWGTMGGDGVDVDGVKLVNFGEFFERTNVEVTIDTFFKGCFTYHWHNHWKDPEYKDSYAGRLNQDIDRIIIEKYGITPAKIFQN